MTDDLAHLTTRIRDVTAERGWQRFHYPRSLVPALVGEVGELAELFQWVPADEAVDRLREPGRKQQAADEMSDAPIYLLWLADVLDVDLTTAATAKLKAAAERHPATDKP